MATSRKSFLTQGQIFNIAGIKSGSKQAQIKKILIREGLIVEHRLQVGKTFTSVWEPTEKAYKTIKHKRPKFKGKGGYLHQFIASHMKTWATNRDHKVKIEFFLSNNKAIDLVLQKQAETIFVEIAISPPLDKEVKNIKKDLETEIKPNQIILVVPNSKIKKKLIGLILSDKQLGNHVEQISVELAGDYIEV